MIIATADLTEAFLIDRQAYFAFPKLVVSDLHAQDRFYRAVLGFGAGMYVKGEIAGRPIHEFIYMAPDGKKSEFLILAYLDDSPAVASGEFISGFFTRDLDAFEERVLAAGGSVRQPIGPIAMPGGPSRLAFYADPEGHLMEVIEQSVK